MKNLILILLLIPILLLSQSILVKPYLQNASYNSIVIMWEIDQNENGHIEWGETENLGNITTANSENSESGNYIFTTTINDLNPNTRYYYKSVNGNTFSELYSFYTEDITSNEASTKMIVMSDMQKDSNFPNKFYEVVHDGILNYVLTNLNGNINEEINLILIPGDLVENGLSYEQWQEDFFNQADPLFSFIPVYPVPGNHENDSPFFFEYFNLPLNGTPGYEEHWWFKDISNVRIIGLDSNGAYRITEQLNWLEGILTDASNNPNIDFVFAQLHHPHKSELWTPGNTDYTGEVISLLENFSTNSGKPSIHFFGHTHGYSRGQSKNHNHLMVNVATAGGNIDSWGEYPNNDYDEFTVSQAKYGYVLVETIAGKNPKFTLKRFNLGDKNIFQNNSLEDSITIRLLNTPPETPIGIFPNEININPDCIMLLGNTFYDEDGDEHGATQWQISTDCNDFSSPIFDKWRQFENWYNEENTQENDNLIDEEVNLLEENTSYCWRVRYRDKSLVWSNWSEPIIFETGTSSVSENLLENFGAEDGINSWIVESGILESLSALECNGTNPFSGEKYFSVGGICEESEFGYAYQIIDVSNYSEEINMGLATAFFGAQLSNWGGSDTPSIGIEFLDEFDEVLFSTNMFSSTSTNWNLIQSESNIPYGTKKIKYKMTGERFSGTDNDSYIDENFLKIDPLSIDCSYYIENNNTTLHNNHLINLKLSPNPFKEHSILSIPLNNKKHVKINIYDSVGQLQKTYNNIHPPTFILKKENFKPGIYFLELLERNNKLGILKFEITN